MAYDETDEAMKTYHENINSLKFMRELLVLLQPVSGQKT